MSIANRNLARLWRRRKLKRRTIDLKLLDFTHVRKIVRQDSSLLCFPKSVRLLFIKNTDSNLVLVYVYDALYSVVFSINLDKVVFFKYYADINALGVRYAYREFFFNVGLAHLTKFLRVFFTMFVIRLRVRGRLYRIYKRNIYRDLQYRFGHTHKVSVYTEGLYVKYIKKKRIRIWGYDYQYLIKKSREAREKFPTNIYTGRGVRIGGQRFFARIGKTVKYY